MRDFLVFAWNLQVYGSDKATKHHMAVAEKVAEAIQRFPEGKNSPFIGFFLEVMGSKKNAEKALALLIKSIGEKLKDKSSILGDIQTCDAQNNKEEYILIVYRRMHVAREVLDIRGALERYMISDIVSASVATIKIKKAKTMFSGISKPAFTTLMALDAKGKSVEKRVSTRETKRNTLFFGKSPSIDSDESDGEEDSMDSGLFDFEISTTSQTSNNKAHYDALAGMFKNLADGSPRYQMIESLIAGIKLKDPSFDATVKETIDGVLENLESDDDSYYSSHKIQNMMNFCRNLDWYRNGVVCACSSLSGGSTIRIAAVHAPGPKFSNIAAVPNSIKEASLTGNIDILIGDLNVRMTLGDDNFEDSHRYWDTGTTISKEKMEFGKSKWDRILLKKTSGISCITDNPLLPGYSLGKELSDHGLIIGYVSRAVNKVAAFFQLKDDKNPLTKRKGVDLDEDEIRAGGKGKNASQTGNGSKSIDSSINPRKQVVTKKNAPQTSDGGMISMQAVVNMSNLKKK